MPRQARPDAHGTLHHVMGRGMRGPKYFGRILVGKISFLEVGSYAWKVLSLNPWEKISIKSV